MLAVMLLGMHRWGYDILVCNASTNVSYGSECTKYNVTVYLVIVICVTGGVTVY